MNNQKNNDYFIDYLNMIERVIERMANNCFQLKGWAVALVSIVGALTINGADSRIIVLLVLPLIAFWILDAHYLKLERKYQILYRNTLEENNKDLHLRMDIGSIKPNTTEKKRITTIACLFSKIEMCFYGCILIAVILLECIMKAV